MSDTKAGGGKEAAQTTPEKAGEDPGTDAGAGSGAGWTTSEIADLAEARAKRAAEAAATAKKAARAEAQEEYEAAAKEAGGAEGDSGFTNKRAGEVIFKREMGEPEFWLTKEGLIPPRPVLSPEEEKAVSQRVEIPADQTPQYSPKHVLSPEYAGMSGYEIGVGGFRDELLERLAALKADPGSSTDEIRRAEEDLAKMDTLYENYHIGMNVFRTAKGGRDGIR